MRTTLFALTTVALLLSSSFASGQTMGRYPGHQAWASYHIHNLAPEIRSGVLSFRRACGLPFAATHTFLRPTHPDTRLVTLHYENLWCAARAGGICKGDRCLHEVYARSSGRYRLVFRGYAREVEVEAGGKVAVIGGGG